MALTENEKNFIENTVYIEIRRAGGPIELFKEAENGISEMVRNTNETNRNLTPFQDMFISPQQIPRMLHNSLGIVPPTGIEDATVGDFRKHFIKLIHEEVNMQGFGNPYDKEHLVSLVEEMPDNNWQFNRELGELIVPPLFFSEALPALANLNRLRQERHYQTQRRQGGLGHHERQARHERQGGKGRKRM